MENFAKRTKITVEELVPEVRRCVDTPPAGTVKTYLKRTFNQIRTDIEDTVSTDAKRVFTTSSGDEFGGLQLSAVRPETAAHIIKELDITLKEMCDKNVDEQLYDSCITLHANLINTLATMDTVLARVHRRLRKGK